MNLYDVDLSFVQSRVDTAFPYTQLPFEIQSLDCIDIVLDLYDTLPVGAGVTFGEQVAALAGDLVIKLLKAQRRRIAPTGSGAQRDPIAQDHPSPPPMIVPAC